jgi:hypothetical protein
VSAQRGGEQFPEHPVCRRRRGGHDEDVSRLDYLDGGVDHHVVAGRSEDRHRRSGDTDALLDRMHAGGHQTDTPRCLVDRGHSRLAEPGNDFGISTGDVADDHRPRHDSSEVTWG